ncbi:hypothetical protein VNO77_03114 [Canavalia gladiata]|uniref:Uncharacterized protein n=1 Tax=Canavalia gladiata TaxID=3824 RepID=A0AAN9RBX5_CANGL
MKKTSEKSSLKHFRGIIGLGKKVMEKRKRTGGLRGFWDGFSLDLRFSDASKEEFNTKRERRDPQYSKDLLDSKEDSSEKSPQEVRLKSNIHGEGTYIGRKIVAIVENGWSLTFIHSVERWPKAIKADIVSRRFPGLTLILRMARVSKVVGPKALQLNIHWAIFLIAFKRYLKSISGPMS